MMVNPKRTSLKVWLFTSAVLLSLFPVKRLPSLASAQLEDFRDQYGNHADGQSNIVFADFNKTVKIETPIEIDLIGEGMSGFFKLARAISKSLFSSGYPYQLVEELVGLSNGDYTLLKSTRIFEVTSTQFSICLIVGILIFIVCLTLLLYLPCCLCSRCCGRYKRAPPSVLRVNLHGLLVIALVGLAWVGLVAAYLTFHYLTLATSFLLNTYKQALRDTATFMHDATDEILFIFTKAEFAKDVFFRDVVNIGKVMGDAMKTNLMKNSGIEEALRNLKRIDQVANSASRTLASVDTKLGQVQILTNDINTELKTIAAACPAASNTQCPTVPTVNVQRPNLMTIMTTLNDLLVQDLTHTVNQQLTNINTIPNRTQQAAESQITDLKKRLQDQLDVVDQFREVVVDVKSHVLKEVNDPQMEASIDNVKDDLMSYQMDTKLMMVMPETVALALVTVGAVMLMLRYWRRAKSFQAGSEPGKRCINLIGGALMYVGIILFVLFAWMCALCAMFFFLIGSPMNAVFCAVINDPDFAIVDSLVEERNLLGTHEQGTWVAVNWLPIPNATVTLGSLLRDCRADKSLFRAVDMDKHPLASFSLIIDFLDKLNISSQVNSINVTVGNVDPLTPEIRDYLDQVNQLDRLIPFDDLKSTSSIQSQRDNVTAAVSSVPGQSTDDLDQLFETLEGLQGKIEKEANILKSNVDDIDTLANRTRDILEAVPQSFQGNVKDALRTAATYFVNRLSKIVRSFIQEAKKNVFIDYGKCGSLYNKFLAVLQVGVCDNMVNILNGCWLALYWMITLMIAAIFPTTRLHRLIPSGAESSVGPAPRAGSMGGC